MMKLTSSNYHSTEANRQYWSSSLFKAFDRCEAAGLASVLGEYTRPETKALLLGSYVDAYFAGELEEFTARNGDKIYKKNGDLYSDYVHARDIIAAVEAQPTMLEYLTGDKQTIMTAVFFDVPWKIKMDVYDGTRIVDLKCVKDFKDIYQPGFGFRSWVEYWAYDIQGAIYQKVVEENTGKRVPFYLAAVTKEPVPDVDLIEIPQPYLDAALEIVKSKIDGFDLVKLGEIPPKRCGVCDYCKRTKKITGPKQFEPEEG